MNKIVDKHNFILESNGKFKIDYDYTDLSEASPREQHIMEI